MLLSLFEFDNVITFPYDKNMEADSCMLLTRNIKF